MRGKSKQSNPSTLKKRRKKNKTSKVGMGMGYQKVIS
jgi:hypothetical protein